MSLIEEYHRVRKHTESITAVLQTEDFVAQPAAFVSPPKWHLAHTSWFFEEFLLTKYLDGYKPFSPDFSFLFNSYYNNVGKRVLRHERGAITRPGIAEVMEYRRYVDMHMDLLMQLQKMEVEAVVYLGINHEQQHQELLFTDIKFILGSNPTHPVYSEDNNWEQQEVMPGDPIIMPEGIYEIGHRGEGFSFDNEHGRHKAFLHEFELNGHLATNAEYIEFIADGGYTNFNLWLDEGWAWVKANNITGPMYWLQDERKHFTLSGLQEINPNAPVTHISYYEATAFAEWKGMRLPTEQEWEAASHLFTWGTRWEWTGSAYLPYPGFHRPEGAVGEYNGKFMISQMVLRGASCATPAGHSRPTYRNFFHPCERWQYTGIRLAKKQTL